MEVACAGPRWGDGLSRSLLILKVLTNAVYQSLHTIDGVPDVLASDLSVSYNQKGTLPLHDS